MEVRRQLVRLANLSSVMALRRFHIISSITTFIATLITFFIIFV